MSRAGPGPRFRPAGAAAGLLLLALAPLAPAVSGAPPASPAEHVLVVLPLDNRTPGVAPTGEVRSALVGQLQAAGFGVVPDDALEAFLARYRVRYTGGVSDSLARKLTEELGATGILVTTLDLYDDSDPPGLALTARLLVPGAERETAWIDDFAMIGDESPGFLGIAVIHEIGALVDRAARHLVESLSEAVRSGFAVHAAKPKGRFAPRRSWVSERLEQRPERPPRVAVMPFRNESLRRHAGELVSLAILRQLATRTDVRIVDPGEVRRALLQARLVAEEGISVPQVDVLRVVLKVDLVWTGTVFEYVEGRAGSPPRINFTSSLFDASDGRLVASTLSHDTGNDRVFFFDVGRIWSAHRLVAETAAALVSELLERTGGRAADPATDDRRGGS